MMAMMTPGGIWFGSSVVVEVWWRSSLDACAAEFSTSKPSVINAVELELLVDVSKAISP